MGEVLRPPAGTAPSGTHSPGATRRARAERPPGTCFAALVGVGSVFRAMFSEVAHWRAPASVPTIRSGSRRRAWFDGPGGHRVTASGNSDKLATGAVESRHPRPPRPPCPCSQSVRNGAGGNDEVVVPWIASAQVELDALRITEGSSTAKAPRASWAPAGAKNASSSLPVGSGHLPVAGRGYWIRDGTHPGSVSRTRSSAVGGGCPRSHGGLRAGIHSCSRGLEITSAILLSFATDATAIPSRGTINIGKPTKYSISR